MSDDDIEMDNLDQIQFDTTPNSTPDPDQLNNIRINKELAYELFLKKIAEKSLGYKWMHDQDRYYYENINYFLKIVDIILTSILAVLTCGELFAISMFSGGSEEFYLYTLSVQLLFMFCNFVIRSVREFTKYHIEAENHRLYAIKFGYINNKIQKRFTQDVTDSKKDSKTFINETAKSFNELLDSAPSIRKKIINKYIKEVDNQDSLGKQPIIGGYDKIEIIVDTNNFKTNISPIKKSNENEYKYEMRRWLQYT